VASQQGFVFRRRKEHSFAKEKKIYLFLRVESVESVLAGWGKGTLYEGTCPLVIGKEEEVLSLRAWEERVKGQGSGLRWWGKKGEW